MKKVTCLVVAALAALAFVGQVFAQSDIQAEARARLTLVVLFQECQALPSLDGAVFGCLDPMAKAPVASAAPAASASDAYQDCLALPTLDGGAFGCLAPAAGRKAEATQAAKPRDLTQVDLASACLSQPSLDGAVFGCLDPVRSQKPAISLQVASAELHMADYSLYCLSGCSMLAP